MTRIIKVSDPIDYVELTKRMMCIYEFGKDEYGQIILYTNCREFSRKVHGDNGELRGMGFGIEEMEWEEME